MPDIGGNFSPNSVRLYHEEEEEVLGGCRMLQNVSCVTFSTSHWQLVFGSINLITFPKQDKKVDDDDDDDMILLKRENNKIFL